MANVLQLPRCQLITKALFGLTFALYLLALVPGGNTCPLQLPNIVIDINGVQLNLEIATTPEARRCGLSKRADLPPDAGMLFVLPETMPFAVWMKDTHLPLDIAFIDTNGKIVAIEQMDPLQSNKVYASPLAVRYAIEVSSGWFKAHHVRVGDSLKILLPTAAPPLIESAPPDSLISDN